MDCGEGKIGEKITNKSGAVTVAVMGAVIRAVIRAVIIAEKCRERERLALSPLTSFLSLLAR